MIATRGANQLLENLVRSSNAYAGISSTKPTVSGGNFTEPTEKPEYKRPQVNSTYGFGTAAANGQISNSTIIYFPEARSTYPRLTYIGLFNSLAGTAATSLLQFSPILSPEYVRSGAEIDNVVTFEFDPVTNEPKFVGAVSGVGDDYVFTYSGTSWQRSGLNVSLSTYGIIIDGSVIAAPGDTLTVRFGIVPENRTLPLIRVGAWNIKIL